MKKYCIQFTYNLRSYHWNIFVLSHPRNSKSYNKSMENLPKRFFFFKGIEWQKLQKVITLGLGPLIPFISYTRDFIRNIKKKTQNWTPNKNSIFLALDPLVFSQLRNDKRHKQSVAIPQKGIFQMNYICKWTKLDTNLT